MKTLLGPTIQVRLQQTLMGLGYRLVDMRENPRQGLFQLFIEPLPKELAERTVLKDESQPQHDTQDIDLDINGHITVEDCAWVSQHITRWLNVENIDYQRLEVSSPGLDRRLTTLEDFRRFVGQPVYISLKAPMIIPKNLLDESAHSVAQQHFRGSLLPPDLAKNIVFFVVEGVQHHCLFTNIEEARIDEETLLEKMMPTSLKPSKPMKSKKSRTLKVKQHKQRLMPLSNA